MKNSILFKNLVLVLLLLPLFANAQSLQIPGIGQIPKEYLPVSEPSAPTVLGIISGQVTDCNTNIGISNVAVVADNGIDVFETETDQNGNYSLTADTATYELSFVLLGFQTETQSDIVVTEGNTTTANQPMCEMPYPVSNVVATPEIACDDEITVSWDPPMGAYAIIQDDGSAEDFAVWASAGGAVAVKFSPAGYPATVTGGKLFVGDGTFPAGGDWLGDDVAVGVADDDGTNGMPGTITDSVIVSVDEYGWLEFPDVFNSEFNSGDFYIVMWQLGNSPDAAPIGIDTDQPIVYRSYAKMANGQWFFSPYQDYMIRADVSGPTNSTSLNLVSPQRKNPPRAIGMGYIYYATNLPYIRPGYEKTGHFKFEENACRDLNKYNVFRMFGFDPNIGEGPEDGTPTGIGSSAGLSKNDTQMGAQPSGFYAYAVEAEYDSGDKSTWSYSNIVIWCMDNVSTFEITTCDTLDPSDAEVTLIGLNYPYQVFSGVSDTNGFVEFDGVVDGHYDITVEKVGYQKQYFSNEEIYDDYFMSFILQENAFPARNLSVDALTSVAPWEDALILALPLEDFEEEPFPPEGWITYSGNPTVEGWFRSFGYSDNFWTVPPQFEDNTTSWFAVSEVEVFSYQSGSSDYLITPEVDLRQSEAFILSFDSYFNGTYGDLASVDYSIDGGNTWYLLRNMIPNVDWTNLSISLASLSGISNDNDKVSFLFHLNVNSSTPNYWAIDNVSIHNGPAPIMGYYVYLDDGFVAMTSTEVTTYTFENLVYAQEYTAKVRAVYSCGLSSPIEYTWTSTYLHPPRNLFDEYLYNTDEIPLKWNPPMISVDGDTVPDGVIGFNIYRDSILLANIPYENQQINDFVNYVNFPVDPGIYHYSVSAIYDLSVFDSIGQTGESMLSNTDTVEVIWGMDLPFYEDWAQGSFDFQDWGTDSANWVISSFIGNSHPSAEFSWEPQLQQDYSASLTSSFLKADLLSEGSIFLEFELKLDDRNSTGEEKLLIEYQLDNGIWRELRTFVNNGSFDFTLNRIELPHRVMGDIFRLRFNAIGQNSYNIVGWYIDNISVYRSCKAPAELSGEYVWNSEEDLGIEVCWESPDIEYPGNYCRPHWDNGENAGGIGLSNGGTFSCAAHWDVGMLEDCNESFITKIGFFPNDDGFSSITVKVWYGPNAETLVAAQEIPIANIVVGMYNEIEMEIPVEIDATQELWIGYTINNSESGAFPAGHDPGSAVSGYGDKICLDGSTWDNLSDFGPDFNVNWNIYAFSEWLDNPQAKPISLTEAIYNSTGSSLINKANEKVISAASVFDRDLAGFNIYRKQEGEDHQFYAHIPWVEGQDFFCFWDAYPAVNLYESYSYKVTAVYESGIDDCESVPARAYYSPDEDFVEVFVTDIKGPFMELTKLYPNPAKDYVHIHSSLEMNHITVYNSLGQLFYISKVGNTTDFTLNTASYENGVYIIQIKTNQDMVSQRFVIVH